MQIPNPYPVEQGYQEGLLSDLAPTQTPNTVLVEGENMHVLNEGTSGEQQILQNDRGTIYRAGMPQGWVVIGSASFNEVEYFLLAEYVGDVATGRGQIGSFPSPQPSTTGSLFDPPPAAGQLLSRYRPFHNYQPLLAQGIPDLYPFEASEFNFSLEHPLEVKVQADYDGTVNVIFNDGINPPRLINSRFAVQPGNAYTIIDRDGDRDTNLYSPVSFGDTIRLFQRSKSLARLDFISLLDGGQVAGGTWTYYAAYVNQDGQATDVVAWSPLVPVFDGLHYGTARGTSAATNQRVQLELSGLDESYQFVRVYAVHAGGLGAAEAITAYQLPDVRLFSNGGRLSFIHSGYEQAIEYDRTLLSLRTGSIDSFQTMDEVDNMLAFAGGRTSIYDDVSLREFAQRIRIHTAPKALHSPGVENDGATMGTGRNDPFASFSRTQAAADGRLGGYLNPWNVAYRLGYPTGEALAFGLVVRLNDGSDSAVFPVRGHDHLTDAQLYDLTAAFDARGWAASGENLDGVYRFPQLSSSSLPDSILGGGELTILGVSFELPDIPVAVRAMAAGAYFVRLARRADRLCQGYAVPVLSSVIAAPNGEVLDHADGAFKFLEAPTLGRQDPNLKVVPAIAAIVETSVSHVDSNKAEKHVVPFQFASKMNSQRYSVNPWRLAFYSPDTVADPDRLQTALQNRNLRMSHQATVTGRATMLTPNTNEPQNQTFKVWKSLLHVRDTSMQARAIRSFWTEGSSGGANEGGFGSQEKYLAGKHHNEVRYLIQTSWDEYVGLLSGTILDGRNGSSPFERLTNNKGFFVSSNGTGQELGSYLPSNTELLARPIAWVMNLYPVHVENDTVANLTGGARPRDVLRDLYAIDTETYFPITPVLSWTDLEAQLDDQRRLVCFGGDTYKTMTYRRLSRSLKADESPFDATWTEQHVGQVLSIVAESDVNPYGRLRENQTRPGEGVPRSWWAATYEDAGRDAWLATSDSFKAPETRGYNAGFARTSGYTLQLALPRNLPFRATTYPNQVAVTAPHVAGSFQNGYRRYVPGSAQTYSPELGPILALRAVGRTLVMGHQHGVSTVAVNERTQTGGDSAGSVFLEVTKVLTPYNQVQSKTIGALSTLAMVATDDAVYGLYYAGVWRWRPGAQLELLSSLRVDKLLLQKLRYLGTHRGNHLLRRQAKLSLDNGRGDLLISLMHNLWAPFEEPGEVGPDPYFVAADSGLGESPVPNPYPFTSPPDGQLFNWSEQTCVQLVYSYRLDKWMPHTSYRAQHHFNQNRQLYSLPLPGIGDQERPGIFCHTGRPGIYYDQPHEAYFEVIVLGSGPEVQHILDNLLLLSNEVYPLRIEYTPLDKALTAQPIVPRAPGNILRRNAEYREDRLWVSVPPTINNMRQRAPAIRVRVVYFTRKRVLITKLLAFLKDSSS